MTYKELYESAIDKLEKSKITLGEFEKMIEPLNAEIAIADADTISRQAAIDALDVLCQEHRYKIPGKGETYSQYNEAWQDALDRAEGAIFNLPPAEPKRGKWIDTGGYRAWYAREYRCSKCGDTMLREANFCPKCGSYNGGEQDDSV